MRLVFVSAVEGFENDERAAKMIPRHDAREYAHSLKTSVLALCLTDWQVSYGKAFNGHHISNFASTWRRTKLERSSISTNSKESIANVAASTVPEANANVMSCLMLSI